MRISYFLISPNVKIILENILMKFNYFQVTIVTDQCGFSLFAYQDDREKADIEDGELQDFSFFYKFTRIDLFDLN